MGRHLVIQLARFGDVIQTKRLLLSLAAAPGDVVHLAVDSSLGALARQAFPFAVVHEVRTHATNADASLVLAHNRTVFGELAETSFESVYNLNFSGMALALAGLFDPDGVRGYSRRNGQAFRSQWFRMGFRWMENRRVAPINLVDFWAHLHPNPVASAKVNPEASPRARKKVAIVAAGRGARRSLPPEVFAPIIEAVFASMNGPELVVLGSRAERPFARKIARLVSSSVLQKLEDACGKTTLLDLPELLDSCALVLTPDTGIMHLAAHLGVPTAAFFLSSAWNFETGPYGSGHTIYQAARKCAPCVESRPCPFATACLSPFASHEFLRALRGKKTGDWPQDLVALRSRCDDLGCDYELLRGEMVENSQRLALRGLLAEYVGRGTGVGIEPWGAKKVFHETDWMLPHKEANCSREFSGEE